MRGWQRALLGALLVGAVAVAGIALNFTLLRLTQDSHDPVGKLSPRAVFTGTRTDTGPATTTATTGTTDELPRQDDGHGAEDDDD
jgi:hypothetical protein